MDPFQKLPEEIYDQILKHFTAHELLYTLSLISRKWYEVIGKSVVSMEKVRLNLKSRRRTDFNERIEMLKWMSQKSSRKYLYITANCLFDEKVSKEFFEFLKTESCAHLVDINIRSMKINFEVKNELKLPKLEQLKVMFIPRDIVNSLMVASENLRKLILWNETPMAYDDLNYLPNETTIECAQKCMERNIKLEVLEIQGRANFYAFFHEDISKFVGVNLKKLTVKNEMSPQFLTENQEKNFISFLKTQKDTLEYIYVDKCGPKVIEFIFNKMPNLTTIRFDIELQDPNKFDVKNLNLMPNEKIQNFELAYVKLFDDLKDYLDLVPNVKEILIGHMNPRVLQYVSNLPNLELIVYRYDDCAGGCEAQYENLKRENPEIVNKNIKMTVCNDFM